MRAISLALPALSVPCTAPAQHRSSNGGPSKWIVPRADSQCGGAVPLRAAGNLLQVEDDLLHLTLRG